MNTKKFILLGLLSACILIPAYGQIISRSVIGSTGSNNEQLSFTVGEAVIETADAPQLILTQGFQQPDQLMGTFVDPLLGEATFLLYPNPTTDKLVLEIETEKRRLLKVGFTDIRGRRVALDKEVELGLQSQHDFDVSVFAMGTYLLLLKDEGGRVIKSFRFTKQY